MKTTVFNYVERYDKVMAFAAEMGVNLFEYRMYCANRENFPEPGDFHLKNGSFCKHMVWQQEDGVYISPNAYIKLDAMGEKACLWRDAENSEALPTYLDREFLKDNLDKVNHALKELGKDPVSADCWYENAPDDYQSEDVYPGGPQAEAWRHCLPLVKEDNIDECFILLDRLKCAMCVE